MRDGCCVVAEEKETIIGNDVLFRHSDAEDGDEDSSVSRCRRTEPGCVRRLDWEKNGERGSFSETSLGRDTRRDILKVSQDCHKPVTNNSLFKPPTPHVISTHIRSQQEKQRQKTPQPPAAMDSDRLFSLLLLLLKRRSTQSLLERVE